MYQYSHVYIMYVYMSNYVHIYTKLSALGKIQYICNQMYDSYLNHLLETIHSYNKYTIYSILSKLSIFQIIKVMNTITIY